MFWGHPLVELVMYGGMVPAGFFVGEGLCVGGVLIGLVGVGVTVARTRFIHSVHMAMGILSF